MRHADLSERIISCAITVHSAVGPGYAESIYQACMSLEMAAKGLRFQPHPTIVLTYRDADVGTVFSDFLVEDLIVVELKAVAALGNTETRQLLQYLRCSEHEIGLLLNFGQDRVQIMRKVFDNALKRRPNDPDKRRGPIEGLAADLEKKSRTA